MVVKQRVGSVVIKFLFSLYKITGYKPVYYSLYGVVFYYFLFAHNVRDALKDYYGKIGRKFTAAVFFRHLFYYAVTMTDRFISKVNPELYSFSYGDGQREELLKELKDGSILLLSHYGGWATASNFFRADEVVMNVVMNEAMMKSVKQFEDLLDKKNKEHVKIIDLSKGGLASTIEIANALLNHEGVAMMGDRTYSEKNFYPVKFFGETAYFNKNPFQIAYKSKKPIVAVFVIYKEMNRYEIQYKKIEMDEMIPEEEAVDKAIKSYSLELMNLLSENPHQWFNFYKFWRKNEIDN